MRRQQGFAVLEAFIILVVVGAIGFTGWYFWHSQIHSEKPQETASKESSTKQTSPTSTATKPSSATVDTSSKQYLDIKEWGVKIDVGSGMDADKMTYTIAKGGTNEDGDSLVAAAIVSFHGLKLDGHLIEDKVILQQSAKKYGDRTSQVHIGQYWYDIGYSGDDLTPAGVTLNEWKFVAE